MVKSNMATIGYGEEANGYFQIFIHILYFI